jgi:Arc/MetJ family transcription regulator
MRTTINVDDQLLASAKLRAGEQGTTLSGFIENALRETLSVSIRRMEQQPIRLITAR